MCRLTCVLHEDSQPGEADVLLVVLGATFPHQILFPCISAPASSKKGVHLFRALSGWDPTDTVKTHGVSVK